MAVSLDEDSTPDKPKEPPPRTDGKVIVPRMPTFTIFDASFLAISMVTFLVDVGTDLYLVARYVMMGSQIYAGLTLSLVLLPAVVVMILSMRWHLSDDHPVTKVYWVVHFCLWGILHRYILMFKTGVKARKTQNIGDFDDLYRQQSDVCMLRMFESFMESAPQLVLQLYIMLSDYDYSIWTAVTAITSMVSLGWGIAAYTKAMRNTRHDKHKMTVSGLILQTVWRASMIAARMAAISVVACILEPWLFLIMGCHILVMYVWVVSQKTGFSPTKWEESIFNLIMAVTYCFCFFNLKEGPSRRRMLGFYTVIVIENTTFVLIFYFLSSHRPWLKYTSLAIVFGGMALGLSCMIVYYRFFHPVGPLTAFQHWRKDTEKGQISPEQQYESSPDCNHSTGNLTVHRPSVHREFKYLYPHVPKSPNSVLSAPGVSLESSPASCKTDTESAATSTVQLQFHQRPSGVMCSVQDLLANVSCSSDIHIVALPEKEENSEHNTSDKKLNVSVENQDLGVNAMGPSSLERSVTRELDIRLSSEFQGEDSIEPVSLDVAESREVESQKMFSEHNNNHKRLNEECNSQIDSSVVHETQVASKQFDSQARISGQCHNLYEIPSRQEESCNFVCNSCPVGNQKITCSSVSHSLYNHSSPNSIGVPLQSKEVSQTSLNSLRTNGSHRKSASILRTSVRKKDHTVSDTDVRLTSLPHLTKSTIDVTSESQVVNNEYVDDLDSAKPHVPNVELAVIDRMHIIETESSGMSSEGQPDYENIYEGQDDLRRNLPPKPANLIVQNLNETQTTQSSIPHDYENICAVNINREMWGIRHWKTYSDIEDRIHDSSTVKERLQMLDSTLASSLYSENSILKLGVQSRRSVSMLEDCDSVLSRSLPDLSALRLETCFEKPEEEEEEEALNTSTPEEVKDDKRLMDVLNTLRATKPISKSNSVDGIPNYETIWIGDVERPGNNTVASQLTSSTSKSSLVVTIGDVRAKESLCNLYYSTMSDLSFRYYSERMRKNNSVGSLASRRSTRDATMSREMMRTISVPDNKTLLEVSELMEEQRKMEEAEKKLAERVQGMGATPLRIQKLHCETGITPVKTSEYTRPRRKFSIMRERFEHPNWTPLKSPLKRRQSAQRRNSLQDRTAKALQAGMKVFRRPRVHVITPKKGEDNKEKPRLKSPFKSKNTTPSPAIKINTETPTEQKQTVKVETEVVKPIVQTTPKVKTSTDQKLVKGTPKTSTPDTHKTSSSRNISSAVGPSTAKKLTEGPKTSTPEGNKQLPQISILSAVSSVVPSPDQSTRIPLSENIHQNRVSSKSLAVQVTKESGCTQKTAYRTSCSSVFPENDIVNIKLSRVPIGDENRQENNYFANSSSLQSSQSLLNLKTVRTSPLDSRRFSGSQAMFSGALGLPQLHLDTKPAIISVTETTDSPRSQQNISISRIILSSPQSPKFNMQKSTLSPNSKIFSRRI